MTAYDPRRNQRISRARERQVARESRRDEAMAVPREQAAPPPAEREPVGMTAQFPIDTEALKRRANLVMQDALWYARYRPSVWRWTALIVFVLVVWFFASYLFPGRIFPNVYALGVPLGGLTVDEAQRALDDAWAGDIRIALYLDGEVIDEVTPAEIGLHADTRAAAEAAKGVGLSGIPFGYGIQPAVGLTYRVAEDYLVARAVELNLEPKNASYTLRDGIVVGIPGTSGRQLDITLSLSRVTERPEELLNRRRWDVAASPIAPDYPDPAPHLAEARMMASEPFHLVGYDPFTDKSVTWATAPENLVTWLEVGDGGLTVNIHKIMQFLDVLNAEIARTEPSQYISRNDAVLALTTALREGRHTAHLRVSHYSVTYTIQSGDSGHLIARRQGIPYFLIAEANQGRDLTLIYPGDEITLPSKDAVVPLSPIPEKRIVVDLDTQMLYGFENGTEAFSWQISSGYDEPNKRYPTSPGVYQILNHEPIAKGSSITLCNDAGQNCAQWEMHWFMGMYEISTGLMNGFHGQVLLENGYMVMGDSVGRRYTYGCILSEPGNAEFLYNWAPDGVVVEILSYEFPAVSEAGRYVEGLRGGGGGSA
jgi:LysM repeat protein